MKLYTKILGITSLIIIFISIIVLINLKYTDEIYWAQFFLLLIPCFILLHYLISSKLGFSKEPFAKQRFYIISSILSTLSLIIIPLSIYIIDFQAQKLSDKIRNEEKVRILEIKEKLEKPIHLKKDTTVYNLECSLKTRLIDGYLEYIFRAEFLKNERPEIKTFHVKLKEKNGFLLREITFDDKTRLFKPDSKTLDGYLKDGQIKWSDYKEYQKISSFDVSVNLE